MSAIYTHHLYIAGFFLLGAFAHGAIYLIRAANLRDRELYLRLGAANNSLRARFVTTLLQYRSAIISHLSAITLFLGFHTLGLYVHNDVMQAFGTPECEISLSPVFGQWLQVAHGQPPGVRGQQCRCQRLLQIGLSIGLEGKIWVPRRLKLQA